MRQLGLRAEELHADHVPVVVERQGDERLEARAVAVQPSAAERPQDRGAPRPHEEIEGGRAQAREVGLLERLPSGAVERRLERLEGAPQAPLRNLLVPVVGDLAGPSALRGIARAMKARGERLAAFYTSNVEFYLSNGGGFDRFVANLAALPHDGRSVIIRSVFPNRFGWMSTAPGYYSTSMLQPVDDLLEGVSTGRIRDYGDLVVAR